MNRFVPVAATLAAALLLAACQRDTQEVGAEVHEQRPLTATAPDQPQPDGIGQQPVPLAEGPRTQVPAMDAPDDVVAATGRLVAIDADAGTVAVVPDEDPATGAPSTAVEFVLENPEQLEGLSPGDRVLFTFIVMGQDRPVIQNIDRG